MMHEKAAYLKICGSADGHAHFPLTSLEAVVCVTVVIDNPFRATWRLIWRNNCHGTLSLPFKIVMHSSACRSDFSSRDGKLLCKSTTLRFRLSDGSTARNNHCYLSGLTPTCYWASLFILP